MRKALLLALGLALLLLPSASAGVPFEIELEDARYDTVQANGRPVNVTRADIVRFSSIVEDGVVRQRVEMAEVPAAPADSILVRNWYHDSTNGSWHVIDLEVRGDEPDPAKRFKPYRREGDFFNVSVIDARYGLEGSTWVFAFNASLVADATCFDPGVFSEHTPARPSAGPQGLDALFLRNERRCMQTQEPETPAPPPIVVGIASPTPTLVTQEPPGSRTPTPGAPLALAGALVAIVAVLRARRER